MRFLHYSDKGAKDFLELYSSCDLMITTGDLRFNDFAGIEFNKVLKPAFGVYGNHDDGCTYIHDYSICNVHNKIFDFNGLKIGGFQGCVRYNTREMQYTEEEAGVFADTFPYVDILILHAGAFGLLDDQIDPVHTGSKNIRRYIDEKKPRLIFCGHQYSNDEMLYDTTKIYRSYGARIIEVEI